MSNPCWRHKNPAPTAKIDRIRKEGDNFVLVLKDGSVRSAPLQAALIQHQIDMGQFDPCEDSPLVIDELADIVYGLIGKHGEKLIAATANACQRVADEAEKQLDGTSRDLWHQTAKLIQEAGLLLESDKKIKDEVWCEKCGGRFGCWCV
jgi:hypothetical protein